MGATTLAGFGHARIARNTASRTGNIALWTIQVVLAALFLFAGGFKLVMPAEALVGPGVQLPTAFLRFIGVCEFLGALGLVLPWATGIRRELTPIAAAGLVTIMAGAATLTLIGGLGAAAAMPLTAGLLAAVVAWRRGRAVRPPVRLSA
jgi:hypothetical protein